MMLERINNIFLLRELTNVMQQIIENKVNNVSFYTTHNTLANAEHVLKMEQIMNHVRHTGKSLQWKQLVFRLVDDSEELETSLSKILLCLKHCLIVTRIILVFQDGIAVQTSFVLVLSCPAYIYIYNFFSHTFFFIFHQLIFKTLSCNPPHQFIKKYYLPQICNPPRS